MATNRVMTIGLTVGTTLPAIFTSMGRVMLSQLTKENRNSYFEDLKIKSLNKFSLTSKKSPLAEITKAFEQGWYLLNQELEVGLRSLSVPIGTYVNDAYAAINVSVPASRVSIDSLTQQILPRLQNVARKIDKYIADLWPK